MDVRQLMQEACAGDEPDETAVIGLYRSAAAEDLLDDFVAATKELLSQRKNPLQSVAMDVLAEVLLRASEGDSDANELFSLLVTHGKSKEVIIALDEVFDTLSSQNTLDETELDEDTNAGTLTLLVRGYSLVLPRLVLRKAKAEDSIESILKRIRTAANITLPKADQAELEAFLGSTVDLLSACIDWCAKDPSSSPSTTKDICRRHLHSTLELCIPQLNTRVSFLAFQELYPRQAAAAVRRIDLSSVERGGEIFEKAVTLSDTLGDSPQSRLNSVKSSDEANALACFILLAHDMRETPSLEQLGETAKMVMACLTSGLASDEALAWTLRCLHAGSELLPEGPACSLSSALAQVASLSPDSIVRQVAFQALTDLLSRTSPILRNELLAELLSECPFPQMRTAAISLLKRFLIDALASEESSPLASLNCLPLISMVLKHDSYDALKQPFTTVCETRSSVRLLDALGLYYLTLVRDSKNRTGIRNATYAAAVEKTFLTPLRSALALWQTEQSEGLNAHALELFSLTTALERVDSTLVDFEAEVME